MLVSVRPIVLGVTLAVLVFTAPSHPAAQQTTPPTPPAGLSQGQAGQGQTSQQPNSDYGSGGHAVMQNDTAGAELTGTVYDPTGTLRHDETNTYTTTTGGGPERKTEQHGFNFDLGGHLQLGWDLKYDLRGGLTYSDITHYGLHGERTAEEVTNYRTDGYEIKDWSIGTHQWYSNLTTYKTLPPTGTAAQTPAPTVTAAQTPLTPTLTNIGVLFPRSYIPGETITGSLWPSTYAENFKGVPGLSESSFPIQLYHLPDGSPEWSSLRIGVKGDGYAPVNPNGTFSLHIPLDWEGPLQLQARQPDPVAGLGATEALLVINEPVAAPTLTNDQFPSDALERFDFYSKDHLVSLWQDACDMEEILDNLYAETTLDWVRIYAVEEDLDYTYDDIDEIEDDMSPQEVISMAQSMYREATGFQNWLGGQPALSDDDKADLKDSKSWSSFLEDEIGYNKFLAGWEPANLFMRPFSTNPVLTQGKLGEIGGSFPIDPYNTFLHIDKFSITPLAATPYSWYFMPPPGLTAGQHSYIIDSPLYPETIFPVFYMWLYMTADNLNLLKGQSTTYHVILSGLNGLPGGAWSGSSDPTDLVDPSQLSAAQKAVGTSRTGFITLSITNGSPGVIAMQNQFKTYNAASFVPNGSNETDGGVTALVKGSFIILGEAHAYLDPEIGVGIPPGTTLPTGLTNPLTGSPGGDWFPPFSVNYDPATFSNSSFMTSCPGSGAASPPTTPTPTAGTAAPAPCVDSAINDLMPAKNALDDTSAKGSAPATVPISDNTKPSGLDAAKERVERARTKVNEAEFKLMNAQIKESTFFDNGLKNLSDDDQDGYRKASKRLDDTVSNWLKSQDEYDKNPTAENERRLQTLKEQLAIDGDLERVAREAAIEKFNAADRQAWQAAHDAAERAQLNSNDAKNELRAAEEDLNKLQQMTAN